MHIFSTCPSVRPSVRSSIIKLVRCCTEKIENLIDWMGSKMMLPSLASCDLDLWPPDPETDCFMPLSREPLASKLVHLFSKHHVHKFNKRRTNGWTDRWTGRKYMHLASLDWWTALGLEFITDCPPNLTLQSPPTTIEPSRSPLLVSGTICRSTSLLRLLFTSLHLGWKPTSSLFPFRNSFERTVPVKWLRHY